MDRRLIMIVSTIVRCKVMKKLLEKLCERGKERENWGRKREKERVSVGMEERDREKLYADNYKFNGR